MVNEYLDLLEYSFSQTEKYNRFSYLSNYIFDFTTYSTVMDKQLVIMALATCTTISERTNFDYIKKNELSYILMCNMPFIADKIEWGTSIRGAWWDSNSYILRSCGIWNDGKQVFNKTIENWDDFIKAMVLFIRKEDG